MIVTKCWCQQIVDREIPIDIFQLIATFYTHTMTNLISVHPNPTTNKHIVRRVEPVAFDVNVALNLDNIDTRVLDICKRPETNQIILVHKHPAQFYLQQHKYHLTFLESTGIHGPLIVGGTIDVSISHRSQYLLSMSHAHAFPSILSHAKVTFAVSILT